MQARLKNAFIDNLRSDKFKQGKLTFFNPDQKTHCCLGVLCRTANVPPTIYGDGTGNWPFVNTVLGNSVVSTLYAMNDSGKTFFEIADWVEKNVPIDENDCPGHVASEADPKVCLHCDTHIDSLRPPEDL